MTAPQGAIDTLTAAVGVASTPGDRLFVQRNLVMAHVLAGKDQEAITATDDLAKTAGEMGLIGDAAAALVRARIHAHRGRWSEANEEIKKAAAALEGKDAPLIQKTLVHQVWVEVAARAGDKGGAESAFAAYESLDKEGPAHTLSRGYVAWARGDVDAALAAFGELEGTGLKSQAAYARAGALGVAGKEDEAKAAWAKLNKLPGRDLDSIMLWYRAQEASK